MEGAYLPGNIRQRMQELMKEHKITQAQLATRIGSTESAISRFVSGKTDKISTEHLLRIAKVFEVSTDFLLGEVNTPDRTNFDIEELGLSVQAARNLYTGKANAEIVNRLLESPRFAEVTYMIEQYFDDTLAAGFAGQNQMLTTLSAMLRRNNKTDAAVQAARTVNRQKVPVYQADLTMIQNTFMAALREVKKEIGNDFTAAQSLTKGITQQMFTELTKGADVHTPTITPEMISAAVTQSAAGMDGVQKEALDKFGQALTEFLQSTLDHAQEKQNADPEHEQLCRLAQKGDTAARDILLEKNLGFIRKIALEQYRNMGLDENDIGIDLDDLMQEGSIGLLNAIPLFDAGRGMKFLTYAAPALRNAMTDCIRAALGLFEQRMVDKKDGPGFQRVYLDDVLSEDERMLRIEAIADPHTQTPEQIYIQKEQLIELYAALDKLTAREQTYLLYRYGFTDGIEHPLIGAALHFHLSESWTKKVEGEAMDSLRGKLPWWF